MGVSIAGFVLCIILPIAIVVGVCCCVGCAAGATGAAIGGRRRDNTPHTTVVTAAPPGVYTNTSTAQTAGMQPGNKELGAYPPSTYYPAQ